MEPWQKWKSYEFQSTNPLNVARGAYGFAGRFGAAPGGGTLFIDPDRFGRFYSEAENAVAAAPDGKAFSRIDVRRMCVYIAVNHEPGGFTTIAGIF